MGCRKTFTGARLSAHPRALPGTLTSRVSAGRGAAPTRAPPRPAGEDRARVTSWTVDDTVFWRIGTNASTGEKALGASTWYRLSFLAAKTEPGLRRRPEAPKPPARLRPLVKGPAPWARALGPPRPLWGPTFQAVDLEPLRGSPLQVWELDREGSFVLWGFRQEAREWPFGGLRGNLNLRWKPAFREGISDPRSPRSPTPTQPPKGASSNVTPASERQCGLPLPPASSLLCGFQECPGARVLSPATHVLLRLPTLTVRSAPRTAPWTAPLSTPSTPSLQVI